MRLLGHWKKPAQFSNLNDVDRASHQYTQSSNDEASENEGT